ncbi:rRNA pseudouridine synthase [Clostridiaceae bacterium OM08-6BH]|nr:rRNA pseudouridine synthase [Clostridiaceae bacterium OM08-6BH]
MKHYYMFNKPFGCVTAHRDDRFPVVMDYFHSLGNDRLSPVGRLDRETEGLLMITDDGVWNQKMTNPAFHVPKTYEFAALGTLNEENLQRLSEGVLLIGSDRPTTGASVTVTGTSLLSKVVPHLHPDMQEKLKYNLPDHPVVFGTITITEGRKRQIRRMLKVVGCCVIRLKRISMGELLLDLELKPGEYKEIEIKNEQSI